MDNQSFCNFLVIDEGLYHKKLYLLSMNGFERKTHSNKLDKRSPTNIFNCIVQYMRILGLVSALRPLLKFIKEQFITALFSSGKP